jgi:hypothetical protein
VRPTQRLIRLALLASLSIPFTLTSFRSAQPAQPTEDYAPHLGDIMNAIQTRHVKLWYAGKAANWDLASFELRQIGESLSQAAMLYAGIPVSNVTTMATPLRSLEEAIGRKDTRGFSKGFTELTADCNSCHTSMARAFIVIHTPTEQQPLGGQSFAPNGKP